EQRRGEVQPRGGASRNARRPDRAGFPDAQHHHRPTGLEGRSGGRPGRRLLSIHFATPLAALIALAVIVPLWGVLSVSRRATRVRGILGLPEPSRSRRLLPVAAVVALA